VPMLHVNPRQAEIAGALGVVPPFASVQAINSWASQARQDQVSSNGAIEQLAYSFAGWWRVPRRIVGGPSNGCSLQPRRTRWTQRLTQGCRMAW
jgi:hypothetical protein